jgi:hypothetical protein
MILGRRFSGDDKPREAIHTRRQAVNCSAIRAARGGERQMNTGKGIVLKLISAVLFAAAAQA